MAPSSAHHNSMHSFSHGHIRLGGAFGRGKGKGKEGGENFHTDSSSNRAREIVSLVDGVMLTQ